MSIAQNFPIISPSLSLDFANVQALDPRITFARATTATYYGTRTAKAEENLLLQSAVPYPSPWAWTNGYIGSIGSELVTNGDFSSATGWVGNTGIITGGVAAFVAVAGSIYQNILTVGKRYKLELVVSRFVAAGTFRVRLGGGGTGDLFLNITGTGTYTITGIASVNTTFELISYTTASDFDIDSVSVKEFVQNFVAAPDTTLTASTLVASAANATYLQTVTAIAADYTFSVYLRRSTGTGDVQIQAGSGTYVTQTITSTWARYTVTQTLVAGSRTPGIQIVTSGDQVEVWGAQLEQRSTVTAYTPTTTQPITNYVPILETAASGVARFDHNPVTFESLGLLIEEQRTNLLTYSEQFDNAAWAKIATTIEANVVIAPDGTLTGDKLIPNTSVSQHSISQTFAAGTYTQSVYAKAEGYFLLTIAAFDGTDWRLRAIFNLSTGAVASLVNGTASITNVGNGWYRCSVTGTTTGNAGFRIQVTNTTADATSSFAGNGYSGIYIWGAQLETGAFSTSYIPTVASQVTRAADAASMTGTNFSSWYNQAEGSVYCEVTTPVPASTTNPGFMWYATEGIGNNRIELRQLGSGDTSPRINTLFRVSAVTTVNISLQTNTIGWTTNNVASAKISLGYKVNDVYLTSDKSNAPATDLDTTMPSINQVLFSHTGNYKKISYYPIRLSNTNLQALTS